MSISAEFALFYSDKWIFFQLNVCKKWGYTTFAL